MIKVYVAVEIILSSANKSDSPPFQSYKASNNHALHFLCSCGRAFIMSQDGAHNGFNEDTTRHSIQIRGNSTDIYLQQYIAV
jgi:hypothetical protein